MENSNIIELNDNNESFLERAADKGYTTPPPTIPGIEVVDFKMLPTSDLYKNINLVDWQPRVAGVTPEKKEQLKREIVADGLKEALVAHIDPKTGKPAPLTHHRLEVAADLEREFVPVWIVKATSYNDGKRTRSEIEILKEYCGAGPGCLNRPMTKNPLEVVDYVRELKEKLEYGEFDGLTDKALERAAKEYIAGQWAFLDKKWRTQILNKFRDSVSPRKTRSWTKGAITKAYANVPSKITFDFKTGVISTTCHEGSYLTNFGLMLQVIQDKVAIERENGTPEDVIEGRLSNIEAHIWLYIKSGKSLTASDVESKRKEFIAKCAQMNKWPMMQKSGVTITEINIVPQILEPKEEHSFTTHAWDETKGTF